MQYQVPQFIEIEDKIFGPLTFKQFVYLIGGGSICYLSYRFLPFIIAIIIIAPVGGLSIALAFYKINNRPFITVLEAGLKFVLGSKLYLWKKEEKPPHEREAEKATTPGAFVSIPRLSESKLKDLTWSLDINESIYKQGEGLTNREKAQIEKTRNKKDEILSAFKGLPTSFEK